MSKNDGGQAFPAKLRTQYSDGTPTWEFEPGMSLRDYFAAAALTGLIAASHQPDGGVEYDYDATVESAYTTADAMLAERDKA